MGWGTSVSVRLGLALALSVALPCAAERTRLTVYTALETDQLAAMKAAIEQAVPEAEVAWVRGSAGVITDRLLAEKERPGADIILGLALSSLLLLEREGLLAEYRPSGAERLKRVFRDPEPPYTWTGMNAYLGVVCFNTEEAARARILPPSSWGDLLAPDLKGRVVMPHPASSGTAYLLIASWLQSMGETAGWAYMDALHVNIAAYLDSGSAPCLQAAQGFAVAGLSLDLRAVAARTAGAPIEIVIPREGTGWEQEALAVVRDTPDPDLARRVADWAVTRDANEFYAQRYAIVAYPGVGTLPPGYPAYAEARMVRSDPRWMADNRARILAEWTRRYEAKTAPR